LDAEVNTGGKVVLGSFKFGTAKESGTL
jgi:hypothetical protein